MKPWIRTIAFGGTGASTPAADFGLAILRVGVGLMIALGHGQSKVWSEGHLGPPKMFIDGVASMGFPAPTLFAWLSVIAEFFGGLLLAAGLLTRPAALMLVVNMAVATYMLRDTPMFMNGPEFAKELPVLYLLPFIFFLFAGAGRLSMDRAIRGK